MFMFQCFISVVLSQFKQQTCSQLAATFSGLCAQYDLAEGKIKNVEAFLSHPSFYFCCFCSVDESVAANHV